ncbi:hypothetical protein DICVIV_03055 [Dictyocaulus viviparus]|uniref:Uncharacterized protein n=1 Tax=Dictyocaulus viviparus TaxID=29172 RepID=A0A0D8Y283_DICVI|nr:hypothetical protein DICVIV_03055 [Dictyocaulus viviparus]
MASPMVKSGHADPDFIPGPLGCKYDDSMNELQIQLVIPGIKEKTFMKASNTQVFLKSDSSSLSCNIEIIKIDKKQKPPSKTIIDKRYYEVPQVYIFRCNHFIFNYYYSTQLLIEWFLLILK